MSSVDSWAEYGFPDPKLMPTWKVAEALEKALQERELAVSIAIGTQENTWGVRHDAVMNAESLPFFSKHLDWNLYHGGGMGTWQYNFDYRIQQIAQFFLDTTSMYDASDNPGQRWSFNSLLNAVAGESAIYSSDYLFGLPEFCAEWAIQRYKALNMLRYLEIWQSHSFGRYPHLTVLPYLLYFAYDQWWRPEEGRSNEPLSVFYPKFIRSLTPIQTDYLGQEIRLWGGTNDNIYSSYVRFFEIIDSVSIDTSKFDNVMLDTVSFFENDLELISSNGYHQPQFVSTLNHSGYNMIAGNTNKILQIDLDRFLLRYIPNDYDDIYTRNSSLYHSCYIDLSPLFTFFHDIQPLSENPPQT